MTHYLNTKQLLAQFYAISIQLLLAQHCALNGSMLLVQNVQDMFNMLRLLLKTGTFSQ